jgi:tRNA pseudouridine55 synthase
MTDGIIVVDKPSGMTSHDVVAIIRRKIRQKRVGHAGTLDPLATGVLVILVGKSTCLSNKFVGFDKAYGATMKLGVKTHSADIQGEVICERPFDNITREMVLASFKKFTGLIDQVPPMVSAVKHNGERLYKLARQGITVDRPSRQVTVHALDLLEFTPPLVKLYLACSKGTYVRQVAEDVGEDLGCGACITEIRRTQVGPFSINEAVKLDDVNETHIHLWNPSA